MPDGGGTGTPIVIVPPVLDGGQTPYTGWAIAADTLRRQIAAMPAFWELVGVDNGTAALAFVFVGDYADRDGLENEAFALVCSMGRDGNKRLGTSARTHSGEFRILLEAPIPEALRAETAIKDAEYWFRDLACHIADALLAAADTPGCLLVRSADIAEGPFRYDDESIKHRMACWMQVQWGLD